MDMSEELRKLKEAMAAVGGHLQDLQAEQNATTRELGVLHTSVTNLQARSVQQEATMAALGGTFAGIETILTGLLEDREQVQTLSETVTDLVQRVEALEQRAS